MAAYIGCWLWDACCCVCTVLYSDILCCTVIIRPAGVVVSQDIDLSISPSSISSFLFISIPPPNDCTLPPTYPLIMVTPHYLLCCTHHMHPKARHAYFPTPINPPGLSLWGVGCEIANHGRLMHNSRTVSSRTTNLLDSLSSLRFMKCDVLSRFVIVGCSKMGLIRFTMGTWWRVTPWSGCGGRMEACFKFPGHVAV